MTSSSRWESFVPRKALLVVGCLVAVAALVPPLSRLAEEHVAGEAAQFALLGYGAPPLIVLGLPRGVRERLSGRRFRARAVLAFGLFVAVALIWRLPFAVEALHDTSGLVALEAVSLLVVGINYWLEMTDSSLRTTVTARPAKMAMAAVSMWEIWVVAYLMGFSSHAWYPAFHHVPGGSLSLAADQQVACWVLWAVPGLALAPLVFWQLSRWLRAEEGPEAELKSLTRFQGPPAEGKAG